MKFSTIFTIISAVVSTATAGPIFSKRGLGGVTICTGANHTGTCDYQVYTLNGTCHQLPEPYAGNVKTFAPDDAAFQCYPRTYNCGGNCTSPTGCTFGAVDYGYANKNDLSVINWDHLFRSFDCVAKR
ncbi:hypothetical protein GMORB2_2105 [Geosmithia morbida]|uniref:Uncharacterized protein n=1 Tax=Geosmithia morbida TaxID=1094350 RepID=A0A9P5CZ39_9HYPO|nr:uncharacterized protein GMORB2_2105 [Geosmithia morbida]KAF4121143.1 hypothetical protein GMORB2_2105 [Geosmithia morbida]